MVASFDIKRITPAWWGAIAGAAVVGATLFPATRVIAGAIAGGAMLAVANHVTKPCCDGCKDGRAPCAGSGATATLREMMADEAPTQLATVQPQIAPSSQPCYGCGGLDVPQSQPQATAPAPAPTVHEAPATLYQREPRLDVTSVYDPGGLLGGGLR